MAQTTVVNKILGNLIDSIVRTSDAKPVAHSRQVKESATRQIKAQQYVRTNQFEVEATLNGLIEKFSIINREDLAEALGKRLRELEQVSRSKWTPEFLSLFLNLSNRPDQESTLESLELLRRPSPPPSPITWAEIIADDPLTGDLWLDESYSSETDDEFEALHSSDFEATSEEGEAAHDRSSSESLFQTFDTARLKTVEKCQFWNQVDFRDSAPQRLSELQTIREVLAMLRGLPTSLFSIDTPNTIVYHSSNVVISQVSSGCLNDLLQNFAQIGSELLRLRLWTHQSRTSPLSQALEHSISSRLQHFDREVDQIDVRFTDPTSGVVVSILQVHRKVEVLASPVRSLCVLMAGLPQHDSDNMSLELLYDRVCIDQAAGNYECYKFFAEIFFDCLRVYLRPIAAWMTEGTIPGNDDNLLVFVVDKSSVATTLWHDRFALRTSADGRIHAPNFLQPVAKKILNAGKSVYFLRQLDSNTPAISSEGLGDLTYESVCHGDNTTGLLPFSEMLNCSIAGWIDERYGPASSILKQRLLYGCGLWSHLDCLEHVFLSRDGVQFQAFADGLFKRIDSGRKDWDDKFLLTELVRSTLGSGKIHRETLRVRNGHQLQLPRHSIEAISNIIVSVNLPWSVQNVLRKSSMAVYQDVLVFLLQIRRVEYLLGQDSFNLRQPSKGIHRLCTSIRHKLAWFAATMHSYITETVVQGACARLRSSLSTAEDVDAMSEVHDKFVDTLHSSCLLTKNLAPIHGSILSILELSVQYTSVQATQFRITRRSNNSSQRQVKSSTARHFSRRRRRNADAFELDGMGESSDDDDVQEDTDNGNERLKADKELDRTSESCKESLRAIHDEFQRLLRFTAAGLRGVSRAGGNVSWEMLAERLEWGLERTTKKL